MSAWRDESPERTQEVWRTISCRHSSSTCNLGAFPAHGPTQGFDASAPFPLPLLTTFHCCRRLYPFVSCDSEADQVCLLGSYSLLLNRMPRQLADMEWDTKHHAPDMELSSNCLTASKTSSSAPSTVRGTILYTGTGKGARRRGRGMGRQGVKGLCAKLGAEGAAAAGSEVEGWALWGKVGWNRLDRHGLGVRLFRAKQVLVSAAGPPRPRL